MLGQKGEKMKHFRTAVTYVLISALFAGGTTYYVLASISTALKIDPSFATTAALGTSGAIIWFFCAINFLFLTHKR